MTARPSLQLGFLVFLNYTHPSGARASLDEGLDLFEKAERLGFDSGWVRVHHGAKTLSAPFPFLTAAALRTTRIKLGTAVIPAGYEDPLRFAEDAATTDLLSGGRLELALSSGIPTGADPADKSQFIAERVRAIQSAIRGEVIGDAVASAEPSVDDVATITDTVTHLPHGPVRHSEEVRAHPHSPTLDRRLWYGAGSLASALRAAKSGLNLVLSTLNTEADGPTLGDTQAEIITRYREAFEVAHPGVRPQVAVARSILPITDSAERASYGELAAYYDQLVTPEGRYRDQPEFSGQASPLYSGETEEILSALVRDPSLALADTLLLTPLSELDTTQKADLFESVAQHIAPSLGWSPDAALAR